MSTIKLVNKKFSDETDNDYFIYVTKNSEPIGIVEIVMDRNGEFTGTAFHKDEQDKDILEKVADVAGYIAEIDKVLGTDSLSFEIPDTEEIDVPPTDMQNNPPVTTDSVNPWIIPIPVDPTSLVAPLDPTVVAPFNIASTPNDTIISNQ